MIIRQLKHTQYEDFCHSLSKRAYAQPLEAFYTVTMQVDDWEYAVRLQPERHNKIAVLQALQIDRRDDSPNFGLIIDGKLLSAFLDLLLWQGIRR